MTALPPAIICDLDGTLALAQERQWFDWHLARTDAPYTAVIELLQRYVDTHVIIIITGRSDECAVETKQWLKTHDVPYDHLYMRRAGDYRKDAEVKDEIYREHVEDRYTVAFCLDDRDQSVVFWRSLGFPCFQVAPGNF